MKECHDVNYNKNNNDEQLYHNPAERIIPITRTFALLRRQLATDDSDDNSNATQQQLHITIRKKEHLIFFRNLTSKQ